LPTLRKLEPELDKLDKEWKKFESRNYSAHALLVYIYHKHPPKQLLPEAVKQLMDALARENDHKMQKAILKGIQNYHTDRACNKQHGMDWYVLCEEITKRLNTAYARYKG
jgi:hypothetical protein